VCRLLGYVSQSPSTLRGVLGAGYGDFVRLAAERHGDGWGHARSDASGVEIRKEARSAAESETFEELAGTLEADSALVHLRWATLDLGVSLANTHPFGDGRVAFAHNGSITDMPALETLTGDPTGPTPAGDTDSERYWLTVRSAIAREGDDVAGLAAAVIAVERSCHYTSLNCMLLTPTRLVAVCWYGPERIAADLGADYYDLAHTTTGGATVVASSGWHGPGWDPVPNGSLVVVDRFGGRPRIEAVHDLAGV
jgi:predicted glutamine amidotransferase